MNIFDSSELETEVMAIVRASGATKKVYEDRRKAADTADDFIVVKVNGSIYDMQAYGECTLSLRLFARDLSNAKNSKKLSYMQKTLLGNFPASTDKYLFDICPTVLGDTTDDLGFHVRIINIKTTIKTS